MSLFDRSIDAHVAGRLDEAETGYREVLEQSPRKADALHLLGLIHRERGALDEAETLVREALAVDAQPRFIGSLGSVLLDKGDAQQAEAMFRRALDLDPRETTHAFNLGILLLESGRADEAASALHHALTLNDRLPATWRNQGRAMHMLARYADAEACLRNALSLDPADVRALSALGATLALQGRLDEARAACEEAIRTDRHFTEAYVNLGAVLLREDRIADSESVLRAALEIDGNHASAHYNLGTTLLEAGCPADAAASLQRALELNPSSIDAHVNLGRALERQRRLDEAEAAYRRGLAHDETDHDLKGNLSLVLLAKGDYAEGWRLYESRFAARHGEPKDGSPGFAFPQWSGESLNGKSIVVLTEQGFGDALQFARYLPLLKAKGVKRLSVVCDAKIVRLFEGIREVDACIAKDATEAVPEHDFWCFMMSLPLRFGTTLDTVPSLVPYLSVAKEAIESWKRRLPATSPKVGLVWAGEVRPDMRVAHSIDKRRSLHASQFLPLLRVPGIAFVSLQLGATTQPQIDTLAGELRPFDPMSDVTDFADTAAIIENLDLVIAVDTSTAHLAGALNKPVWMLSRFDQCWRWLDARDDSPWYPSMRLFRQQTPGDWDGVIARVADALAEFAKPAPEQAEAIGKPGHARHARHATPGASKKKSKKR